MSTTYTGEVFFGAFVDRRTILGERLERYVHKAGYSPVATEVRGVEIHTVGSSPTGEEWMVVRADGSDRSFSRYDNVVAPAPLTEDPAWRPAIEAFFARLKVKSPSPIGWHFAGSVS